MVVFDKEGQFQARFRWSDQPEEALIMVPWEEEKKIFIIKRNLIFDFPISELLQ